MTKRKVNPDDAVEAILALEQYRRWIASRGQKGYTTVDGQRYAKVAG